MAHLDDAAAARAVEPVGLAELALDGLQAPDQPAFLVGEPAGGLDRLKRLGALLEVKLHRGLPEQRLAVAAAGEVVELLGDGDQREAEVAAAAGHVVDPAPGDRPCDQRPHLLEDEEALAEDRIRRQARVRARAGARVDALGGVLADQEDDRGREAL